MNVLFEIRFELRWSKINTFKKPYSAEVSTVCNIYCFKPFCINGSKTDFYSLIICLGDWLFSRFLAFQMLKQCTFKYSIHRLAPECCRLAILRFELWINAGEEATAVANVLSQLAHLKCICKWKR